MLTGFQGLFSKAIYSNSPNRRQIDLDIEMDLNGKISFHSPYYFASCEEAYL
jgi:hypothetical protein